MTLQLTPVILPLLLAATVGFGLGLYAWRHREGRESALAFALLCFCGSCSALGDALMWASADPDWQYFWLLFARPGLCGTSLAWAVLAARYTGWGGWLNRRRLFFLSVVPVAAVLLGWTNQWHHLIWSNVFHSEWHGVAAQVRERGPLWYPHLAYDLALMLGGVWLILAALVRSPDRYRGQMLALLVAALVPLGGITFYTLHPSPVNPTPMVMTISWAAFAWVIFRHGFRDMIPAARHMIIENMGDAMLVLDPSHRLVDLNPTARRLLGRVRTAVIGLPLIEVLPESARALGAAIAGAGSRDSEVALDGGDYELRISSVRNKDGTVSGRVVLLHDITEQKRVREALRQTEEASRTILDSIADGYYEIDVAGTFTRATAATARIIGLPQEEVVGRSFRELGDPATAERLALIYRELRQTGVALKQLDYTVTTLDGETKYLEASASLMRNAAGEPVGFRGIVRDTTDRKRAEQELEAAKRLAEEASQAKGAFLATVSHELRTPLTSVLGFAKLIKKRMAETVLPGLMTSDHTVKRALSQTTDNVDIIVAEGERLTALINDVLDLAKIEAGKVEWRMQPVSIGEIVIRAIASTTSLSGAKGLMVRAEIEDALPTSNGDSDRLIQVVINLLSNAIKFTDVGAITCRVRHVDGCIEVSVADTGIGIPADDRDKVFEQFVQVGDTLTNKPKGTGLGLPICKQIVEHHGGRIWVESEVGRGSTFVVTLPLAARTTTSNGATGSPLRAGA
jgi:PAS domain S-box-containing protein